jgi:hypothetical protein
MEGGEIRPPFFMYARGRAFWSLRRRFDEKILQADEACEARRGAAKTKRGKI